MLDGFLREVSALDRPVKAADLFCGAGGTSHGARLALSGLGRRLELVAVNHWPRAIETHQLNHADARHHCVNLEAARPKSRGGAADRTGAGRPPRPVDGQPVLHPP